MRSSISCTIHNPVRTHPHPLFTTRPQAAPKNPQTPHRDVSRSCALPRSSQPVIPTGYSREAMAWRVLYGSACPAARWAAGNRPRTRLFERRDGGSGRKARAGRQPDSRQANSRNGETPRASREGFFTVKAEGGGDVKASPRCARRAPGGAEAHEGRGSVETQPVSTDTALAAGSKALKSRARSLVTGGCAQRQEGMTRPGKPGTAPQRGTIP